jgi:hypothetical protein
MSSEAKTDQAILKIVTELRVSQADTNVLVEKVLVDSTALNQKVTVMMDQNQRIMEAILKNLDENLKTTKMMLESQKNIENSIKSIADSLKEKNTMSIFENSKFK